MPGADLFDYPNFRVWAGLSLLRRTQAYRLTGCYLLREDRRPGPGGSAVTAGSRFSSSRLELLGYLLELERRIDRVNFLILNTQIGQCLLLARVAKSLHKDPDGSPSDLLTIFKVVPTLIIKGLSYQDSDLHINNKRLLEVARSIVGFDKYCDSGLRAFTATHGFHLS